MKLITIRFSHFCERARWALDLAGVDYVEEGHLPGFHVRAVKKAHPAGGQKDRASTRFSTPLLVDGDTILDDSSTIARWASAQGEQRGLASLYPADLVDDIDEWVQRSHDKLGIHSRRLAYFHLFNHMPLLHEMARQNVGGGQALALRMGAPFFVSSLKKRQKLDDEASMHRAVDIVETAMADASAHLEERDYLVGDRFTAADLMFACAAAPALVVQPDEGYGAWLPTLASLPNAYRNDVDRWRATRAGQHALRMFREHRQTTST